MKAGESSLQGSFETKHSIEVKPVHKEIKTEVNINTAKEVKPLGFIPLNNAGSEVHTNVEVKGDVQPPVIVKEVYVEQPRVVEKHIIHTHYKPHRHHFHKTAYLGGYIGGYNGAEVVPPVVYKPEPVVQKRIDIGAAANAGVGGAVDVNGGVNHVYTKEVSYQSNPNFFQNIFDIPISTLTAVSNFLSNKAANTNVSFQKSASIQAGAYV